MTRLTIAAVVAAAALLPGSVEAQRTPRRQQTIEIVGQVPTPQVVTVRPREVPNYDRRVLVPTFYDHDFWQSILPAYLIVRERTITGAVTGDSAAARRDSTPPAMTNPPAGSGTRPPAATPPPAGTRPPTGSPPPGAAAEPTVPVATPDAARHSPPAAVSPALPPR